MQSQDSVRRAVLHWKQYKGDKQKHWEESVVIKAKLNHLHLKRTLRYWNKWKRQKCVNKDSTEYKTNTLNTTRIIRMKRCIFFWHCYSQSIYESQKQCIRASAYFNIKQQTQCVLKWNEIMQKKRNTETKCNEFTKTMNKKMITNCFYRWKKQKEIENTLLRAAFLWKKYSNRVYIIRSYNHWRNIYNDLKHKYEYKIKKEILNTFKINMMHNQKCKEKLNQVILKKNEVEIAFMKWKNKVKQMNTMRCNMEHEIKINVIIFWKRNTTKQQRLQYFAEKIYSKHHNVELKRIWTEWKQVAMIKEKSETFLVSQCLDFWRKLSKKHALNDLKYSILTEWIGERELKNVWCHWYLQSLDHIEIRDKTDIATHFYEYKTQSLLFMKWKEFKMNNKKEKKLSKKLKNIHKKWMKRKAFHDWYLLYCNHQYQHKINTISLRFLILKYMKYWQIMMNSTKNKRFNEYKARLFLCQIYFNRWIIHYEPFKIGAEYELQITMSIKPYMDSVRKQRESNLLYYSFKTWFIAKRVKEIETNHEIKAKHTKDFVFNKWRRMYFDLKLKNTVYCWNKSIVERIVDNITSVNKTLDDIQVSLKDLLSQKLEFRQKCREWIYKQQNQETKGLFQLERDINNYLQCKHKRQQKIASIFRDLIDLCPYFESAFN